MKKNTSWLILSLLIGGLLIFSLIGIFFGSIFISPLQIFHLNHIEKTILFFLRLPRLLTAFTVGAFLATAGACFQGVLKNPLADPFILGVSAGAGLGVCISTMMSNNIVGINGFALIGGGLTIILLNVVLLLNKRYKTLDFILAGIMINSFFSAVTMFFIFISGQKYSGILLWLLGDLSKTQLPMLVLAWCLAMPSGVIIFLYMRRINLLALGDEIAHSLGVSVTQTRQILIVTASILTALSVALGGIIGFIGLVIPHIIRLLIKDNFSRLIPFSFLLGGVFLMAADTLARVILPTSELPVGILTALIGAPFFLYLLLKKQSL